MTHDHPFAILLRLSRVALLVAMVAACGDATDGASTRLHERDDPPASGDGGPPRDPAAPTSEIEPGIFRVDSLEFDADDVDLRPLDDITADAQVVAFGE